MTHEIRALAVPAPGQAVDLLTVKAADLLNTEIFTDPDGRPGTLEDFIRHLDRPTAEGYALVDASGMLMAAASIERSPEFTFLSSIAVVSAVRRQRYATALMHHIAAKALEVSSPRISLYANTTVPEFYASLGFVLDSDGIELSAAPQTILRKNKTAPHTHIDPAEH